MKLPKFDMYSPKFEKFLIGIIFSLMALSFMSRFLLIDEGLPAVYNSTEKFIAKNTLIMASEKSVTPPQAVYPTFYSAVLAGTWGALFFTERLTDKIQTKNDFAEQFLLDPDLFFGSGRLVTVLLFSGIILMGILFLLKTASWIHGMIFAAGIIFSNVFAYHSFRLLPDILLLLLGISSCFFFHNFFKTKKKSDLIWGAILTGLTIGTKYNAGLLILIPLIMIAFDPTQIKRDKWLLSCLIIVLTLFFFVLSTPGWIIDFSAFKKGFMSVVEQNYLIKNRNESYFSSNLIMDWVRKDIFILIVVSLGWITAIRKKNLDKWDWAILSFILLTFLVVLTFKKRTIDYIFLPILLFYLSGIRHLKISNPKLLIGVFIILIFGGIYNNRLFAFQLKNDSREKLAEWLMQQNPDGKLKILYDHYNMDLPIIDIDLYLNRGSNRQKLNPTIIRHLKAYHRTKENIAVYQWSYRTNTPQWPQNWDKKTIQKFSQNPFVCSQLSFKLFSLDSLQKIGVKYLVLNDWEIRERLTLDTTSTSKMNPFHEFNVAYYRIYSQITSRPADTVFYASHRWEEPNLYVYRLDSLLKY